jgi:glycosyltransferase involved in cell wall biosynthesis
VIVGGKHDLEPDYPDHLRKQIAARGLADHIILAGFQADVPKWMNAMDVIVLPSDNEPFGITVIEAMAMGKPVIAGGSGGPTEIVTSGMDGVLVHHDSAQEIANAVVDCLRRPDYARTLGAAARDRAKEFSTDRYARELISALRELAAA